MTDGKADRLDEIIASHIRREGPLLPILHDIQAEFGFVSEDTKRRLAKALNVTRAEIQGVVSFYHDFHDEQAAHPILKLCRAEACKARGVEALVEGAEAAAKGRVEIETIYCLGLCSVGPNAMVGTDVHARLDARKLATLIEEMA
jgi:formate dehydrogenase subunit gamma